MRFLYNCDHFKNVSLLFIRCKNERKYSHNQKHFDCVLVFERESLYRSIYGILSDSYVQQPVTWLVFPSTIRHSIHVRCQGKYKNCRLRYSEQCLILCLSLVSSIFYALSYSIPELNLLDSSLRIPYG